MVVFLDVDGVLNSRSFFKNPVCRFLMKKFKWSNFNPVNLFWTSLLIEFTRAEVILPSSVRYDFDLNGKPLSKDAKYKVQILKFFGIKISGRTPLPSEVSQNILKVFPENLGDFKTSSTRGIQILDYLGLVCEKTYCEKFLILEDDYVDIVIFPQLSNRLVITSFYKRFGGFRFVHLIKSLVLLKNMNRG